jgi:hypothetical protein
MKKAIIVVLAIGIGAAIVFYFWTFRKADTDVGKRNVDVELTAKSLVENYEMNEDSANMFYLDKILIVEGVVNSITEKAGVVTIELKEETDTKGVLCNFHPKSIKIKNVHEGQTIQVKGICSGYLLDVVLNKCVIVSN